MTGFSRRTLLAGAAGTALLPAAHAAVAQAQPDPILEMIRRHRVNFPATATKGMSDDETDAWVTKSTRSLDAIYATVPTTIAGVVALLELFIEEEGYILQDAHEVAIQSRLAAKHIAGGEA